MTTDPYTTTPDETPAAMPPAGWYPDPQDPSAQRWWDGAQWTDGRSPVGTTASVAASPRRLSTGAIIAIVAGAVVLLAGLVVSAVVAIGAVSAVDSGPTASPADTAVASDVTTEDDTADVTSEDAADVTTGDAADADTATLADGTASVAGGAYTVAIPEGWGVSPQGEIMEGIFGDSALIQFEGAWAPSQAFDADTLMVVSMQVPASEEVFQGGFDGGLATGGLGYDEITPSDVVWTTTADGRMLAYQVYTTVVDGITSSTALAQVEAGEWIVQITLATFGETDATALIETVARSVVPAP